MIRNSTKGTIEKLKSRYNPENDINPPYPGVSWAENDLLSIIEDLLGEIESLGERIESLEETLEKAELWAIGEA